MTLMRGTVGVPLMEDVCDGDWEEVDVYEDVVDGVDVEVAVFVLDKVREEVDEGDKE